MAAILLLCMAALVALPALVVWYAGMELLAPLLWRVRLLQQASRGPQRLLPDGKDNISGLQTDHRPQTRALLEEVTASQTGFLTRDFSTSQRGFQIYVRTRAQTVDETGSTVGIPPTLEDTGTTRTVVSTWVVVVLDNKVSPKLTFHIEVEYDERTVGNEGLVAGLMNGAARTVLARGDRMTLTEARLILESPFLLSERSPSSVIEGVVTIAERLVRVCPSPHQVPNEVSLLRENLESDPSAQVRAQAADLLLSRYRSLAFDVADTALQDPSPEVRLAAARHMGDVGFPVLEELIFDTQLDAPNADELRQRALRFLIREFSVERTLPMLEKAIREGPDSLRQIAIRQIGHLRYSEAVAWLTPLARSRDLETIAAGCESLAEVGGSKAEAILIELLNRSEPSVLRAAVEAIAHIGTLSSAPRLLSIVKNGPTRAIRVSAATTLQLVTARGTRVETGRLSLLDAESAGTLAIASNASLPEEPEE